MEPAHEHWQMLSFASWILALLFDTSQALVVADAAKEDNFIADAAAVVTTFNDAPIMNMFSLMTTAVNNFRLGCPPILLSEEVSFWVKPRSTTWFCRFLVDQYNNSRWLSMFRMTKTSTIALAELLRPAIDKKNTRYRLAVPVIVRVACTLFKLTHGANLTVCSKMFAIGRSTCYKVLREVVHGINDGLKGELAWPPAQHYAEIQAKFGELCSLPGIVGAIDGVQISISKPDYEAADYYYFKSGGYSMNCQAVVDAKKCFLDLYVGMPGSTNDSRILRRLSLFQLATHKNLFRSDMNFDGQSPFLIGDQGYPLLPWLMVPHRDRPDLSISERLFNKKLCKGRTVVENAFGILKQSFRELLGKSNLHLTFLPDVVVCCAIVHNVLLQQSHSAVEDLLRLLRTEGLRTVPVKDDVSDVDVNENGRGDPIGAPNAFFPLDDARLVAAMRRGRRWEST